MKKKTDFFKDLYRGKKVFVTGHTGFKGSWLALWLESLGAEVYGFSLSPPTEPSLFEAAGISSRVTQTIDDIINYDSLASAMAEFSPDIVFHMAAQSLVGRSYKDPRTTYKTNVIGTVNVLEAIRHTESVRVCVNVTSDKCYENKEWVYAYREVDPIGGYDPYSSSKGCAELVASSYRNSFFNPEKYDEHGVSLVSVRAGNVIGGGDWASDRIVPDCIRALSKSEAVMVRNPGAVRPWQFVLEPLSGYLWIGALSWQHPTKYDYAWNFSPDSSGEVSVNELVEKIITGWGGGGREGQGTDKANSFHEANYLKLDSTKARTILNWRPTYDLRSATTATVDWYRSFYNDKSFDAYEFSLAQISEFSACSMEQEIAWAGAAVCGKG